jgi:hypothetical protein
VQVFAGPAVGDVEVFVHASRVSLRVGLGKAAGGILDSGWLRTDSTFPVSGLFCCKWLPIHEVRGAVSTCRLL